MNKHQKSYHLTLFLFFILVGGACTTPAQVPAITPTLPSSATLVPASTVPTLLTITPTQLPIETQSPTATPTLEQVAVTKAEELIGIWQGSTGEGISGNYYWQFKSDGSYISDYQISKTSPGIVLEKQSGKDLFDVEGKFKFEDGKLNLLDTGGLDKECGSKVGVYTVTLYQDGNQRVKIAFTSVDDACHTRQRSATAEAWTLISPGQ